MSDRKPDHDPSTSDEPGDDPIRPPSRGDEPTKPSIRAPGRRRIVVIVDERGRGGRRHELN